MMQNKHTKSKKKKKKNNYFKNRKCDKKKKIGSIYNSNKNNKTAIKNSA